MSPFWIGFRKGYIVGHIVAAPFVIAFVVWKVAQ